MIMNRKPSFVKKSRKMFRSKLQIVTIRVESLGMVRDMVEYVQDDSQDLCRMVKDGKEDPMEQEDKEQLVVKINST